MIFDALTNALYDDSGAFIKTVYCPYAMRPEQLDRLDHGKPDRYCSICETTVRCIDDMSDEQLRSDLTKNPRLCIFATPTARRLVYLRTPGIHEGNPEQLPVVLTVRSLPAMDYAASQGQRLVFRRVGTENEFGDSKFIVYRHSVTGRLWWSGDYRDGFPPSENQREIQSDGRSPWEQVADWFWVRPDRPFPLAAYVVPKDLEPGTHVFVEDVIEDIPIEIRNQGDSARMLSGRAVWTGEDVQLVIPRSVGIVG